VTAPICDHFRMTLLRSAFDEGTLTQDRWCDEALPFFGDGVVAAWDGPCRLCKNNVTFLEFAEPSRYESDRGTDRAVELDQEMRRDARHGGGW
jgi:hypothetical protein